MKVWGGLETVLAASRLYGWVWRAGAMAGTALVLASCATVVLGAREPFQITSMPAGANVQLSTGETCVTPCTLELPRAVAFQVRVSLPGYATQVIPVASRHTVGGAVGFLGNGVVGGLIGASVDVESGAMQSLSPNPLNVRLYSSSPVSGATPRPSFRAPRAAD